MKRNVVGSFWEALDRAKFVAKDLRQSVYHVSGYYGYTVALDPPLYGHGTYREITRDGRIIRRTVDRDYGA